jgi:hypothetical protein
VSHETRLRVHISNAYTIHGCHSPCSASLSRREAEVERIPESRDLSSSMSDRMEELSAS